MAYTNAWTNAVPAGSDAANTIDDQIRRLRLDINERMTDLVDNWDSDPVVSKNDADLTAIVSVNTTQTTNIATNVTNIATNVTNIATNTAGIATNVTDITTNTAAIAVNTSGLAAAVAVNSTQTTNIATNVTNIATNVTNIATNVTNIATNTAGIATNVTDIAANTTAIGIINAPKVARVYTNAAFSLPSGATTSVDFVAEDYDTGSFHSNAANPERLTVPSTGYYHITCAIQITSLGNPDTGSILQLVKNGSSGWAQDLRVHTATTTFAYLISTVILLSITDYVTFDFTQASGDAWSTKSNSAQAHATISRLTGT